MVGAQLSHTKKELRIQSDAREMRVPAEGESSVRLMHEETTTAPQDVIMGLYHLKVLSHAGVRVHGNIPARQIQPQEAFGFTTSPRSNGELARDRSLNRNFSPGAVRNSSRRPTTPTLTNPCLVSPTRLSIFGILRPPHPSAMSICSFARSQLARFFPLSPHCLA